MKSLIESILADIEDNITKGDENIESRCKLNWLFSYYKTAYIRSDVNETNTIKKYFGKKLEKIPVSLHVAYKQDYKLAKKFKRIINSPSMWFEAIILNSKFDEPIEEIFKNNNIVKVEQLVKSKIEHEINSRLLPEYKYLYNEYQCVIKAMVSIIKTANGYNMRIKIYVSSDVLKDNMDNNYGPICEIEFLCNEKHN